MRIKDQYDKTLLVKVKSKPLNTKDTFSYEVWNVKQNKNSKTTAAFKLSNACKTSLFHA